MSAGFHVEGASLLHRLHPSVKIVALGIGFVSTLVFDHPLYLGALFVLYAALSARSGVFTGLKRVWWLMLMVGLLSFVIWSLARSGGDAIWALGPLRLTRQGMLHGTGMGLRLDLMMFLGLVFLSSTSVEEVNYGLSRLGLPFAAGFALSLSIRLVPLMIETVRTITDAQRARGLDPDAGGPLARVKNYVPLLVPVLVSALRRTDQLATALESKGFGRPEKRGSLSEHRVGVTETAALALMAALLLLAILARVRGLGAI
jgi:energy-coupling factor transport system permease protein